ncbi:MAG: hypothetical protein KDK78_08520, partial [Chlamydiia bacterium]|nr:hypothetical protein [Chlamydiia bacterium]
MEIIVEDARVEIDLTRQGVKLAEVVDEVEQYLLSVGRVPTALSIDGHALTQEELESRQQDVLSGRERLDH